MSLWAGAKSVPASSIQPPGRQPPTDAHLRTGPPSACVCAPTSARVVAWYRLSRPLRSVGSARRSRLGTGAPTSRTFHKRAALLWFRGKVLNRRERTAGAEPAASCPAHLDSCRVPSPQEDEGHCCPREPREGLTAPPSRRHIVNPGARDVCRPETQRGHCRRGWSPFPSPLPRVPVHAHLHALWMETAFRGRKVGAGF